MEQYEIRFEGGLEKESANATGWNEVERARDRFFGANSLVVCEEKSSNGVTYWVFKHPFNEKTMYVARHADLRELRSV